MTHSHSFKDPAPPEKESGSTSLLREVLAEPLGGAD